MEMSWIKQQCDRYLDEHLDELWEISRYVHANPELAYEEYKACKVQCDYLKKMGFEVVEGAGNVPTAFTAKTGSGKPVVAIVSEYDALPELGHACGHNLICTSALGAAIEAKHFLDEQSVTGTLYVIGTPAEESGGGKIKLLEAGIFDEVDAVIMQHPTSVPTRLAGACMSSMRLDIEFFGKSAHAGSHPENGINALSAANLYFVATGLLRQHFKGDMRLSGIITEGGKGTGLIPDYAHVKCSISSFSLKDLKMNAEKVRHCAEGCAHALDCEVKITIEEGYQGRVPNEILSEVCRKELMALNEPLLEGMPFDYGGEDLGNVSRRIPICNPYVTIFPDYKISNHTAQFRELAISENGRHCLEIASKAMGRTAMEFLTHPEILEAAKEELAERLKNED